MLDPGRYFAEAIYFLPRVCPVAEVGPAEP
jgi:hypothetical protein